MKILIAIPCMDTVDTIFANSLLGLVKPGYTQTQFQSSSLVYDSRNLLAAEAVKGNFTHVLWLDSDMSFEPDLFVKLMNAVDGGKDIVTALAFARRPPFTPCIYRTLSLKGSEAHVTHYTDYPRDSIFEVTACGMAACLMKTDVFRELNESGECRPFSPIYPLGEDLSFCVRAKEKGFRIYCDSSIKVGHVARTIITEQNYLQYQAYEKMMHG